MKKETLLKVIQLCERADEAETRMIINALNRSASVRRQRMEQEALINIKAGNIVRLRNCKPKYLNGTKALVLDVLGSEGKFRIEFFNTVDPRALRRWGRVVTCPASMIEKKDEDN